MGQIESFTKGNKILKRLSTWNFNGNKIVSDLELNIPIKNHLTELSQGPEWCEGPRHNIHTVPVFRKSLSLPVKSKSHPSHYLSLSQKQGTSGISKGKEKREHAVGAYREELSRWVLAWDDLRWVLGTDRVWWDFYGISWNWGGRGELKVTFFKKKIKIKFIIFN